MKQQSQNQAPNLLDCIPVRTAEYEVMENNRVIVYIPKFPNRFVQKFFPLLAQQRFQMKLDERGSAFWNLCDGTATVFAIAQIMKTQFNESEETFYDRLGIFIRTMVKENIISLQ